MNIFTTLKDLKSDPLNGCENTLPKRTINDYNIFEIFVNSEEKGTRREEPSKEVEEKFLYLPSVISLIISYVGWLCEANQPIFSINYCNFICLLIFLPFYILCDKNIIVPKKGTHAKDIELIVENEEAKTININEMGEKYDNIFEMDFIKNKFQLFVKDHFSKLLEPFKDKENTIIVQQSRITTIKTEFVEAGDIIVVQPERLQSFDCELIPEYYEQEYVNIHEYEQFGGRSYGIGEQPFVDSSLDTGILQELYDLVHEGENEDQDNDVEEYKEFLPPSRIVTPDMSKRPRKDQSIVFENQNYADYLFAGYYVNRIENSVPVLLEEISLHSIIELFARENQIDISVMQVLDPFISIVTDILQEEFNGILINKEGGAFARLIVGSGCYAVCTDSYLRSRLITMLRAQPPEKKEPLSSDTLGQHKFTFFSHLEQLDRELKLLPITLILSLLIIFAPHLMRLLIIPQYSESFTQCFGLHTPGRMALHGLLPAACASLTFCICSLQFAENIATLLRPMLKSASKYVRILQARMMTIPTLGSLESLGFTNALVVRDTTLMLPKMQIAQCSIGMNKYCGMKAFNASDIGTQVFKNRLKRPLFVFPTENDKSYWLCFARLFASISLQNEEIAQILIQKNAQANFDNNIYNPTYQTRSVEATGREAESSESFAPADTGFATGGKFTTTQNVPYDSFKQLSYFKSLQSLDFSALVQPQCLLDANITVQELNPLETYPYLVFQLCVPTMATENKVILTRSSNLNDMLAISSFILSTGSTEFNTSSDNISSEETWYSQSVPFMRLQQEFYHRSLKRKDIAALNQNESEQLLKFYAVEHYAVAIVPKQQTFKQIIKDKPFTYLFNIAFEPQISKYALNFIKRFEMEYNGINLFITTDHDERNCQSLLKYFNLQEFIPKEYQNAIITDDENSEEVNSQANKNTAFAKAITIKNKKLKKNSESFKEESTEKQYCQIMCSDDNDICFVKDYINSKNILKKEHIIEKPKPSKKPPEAEKEDNEEAALLDNEEMMEIDYDDSLSESQLIMMEKEERKKKHRKTRNQEETSVFLVTNTQSSLEFAKRLYDKGLFASWISDLSGPKYTESQISEINSRSTTDLKPDFLIINSETSPLASKIAVDCFKNNRISICSIRGKYALDRLLDACQEIPFYFMTLSPVFLGTIRSRQLVRILPLCIVLSIILIELCCDLLNRDDEEFLNQLQLRPFFMPPVSVGMILLYSMIYIEILLPQIIWSPPSSEQKLSKPNYIGNRAAMLYDFNKLLPEKTSSKAILSFSILFTFLSIFVLLPATKFYSEGGTFEDDYISLQLLKLAPFISLFYCMIFTGFATGALVIANKLPLGRVWGQKLPISIEIKKVVIFVLLYVCAIVFIFVLPTTTFYLCQLILGFETEWIDNSFIKCVITSFAVVIVETIGIILEEALFVRIN